MNDSLPTPEMVGKALEYLAHTDKDYAKLTAAVKALEHKVKTIRAIEFLKTSGTVDERKSIVDASEAFKQFTEDYENTIADREILAATRKRYELTIDVWRSLNSARNKGQMV